MYIDSSVKKGEVPSLARERSRSRRAHERW